MRILKKIHYNSPVILTYALICLFVLLMGMLTENVTTNLLFCVYRSGFDDPLFYFRLFGHVLGHISVEHFFSNFMLILLIGPILEEKYGSKCILLMILAIAFVTGVLNVIISNNALLGASGIAFMFIILVSFVNFEKGRIPLTFILVIIIYIGQEVFSSINSVDNVSRITHIVGGIFGAAIGFTLNYRKSKKSTIKIYEDD